ncbi:MAG: hypothetical protein ACI9VR_001410 [Cognaticolwellia sp.]|jgi:hypothetical protein
MNTETQASLLAEWLEQPGTPPPVGLDPDVVQAAIALRPELAPAPSVSLDDILSGVTTGPFAADSSASGPVESEPQGRSAELPLDQAPVDLEPANSPQIDGVAPVIDLAARRRRRIWGGVGLLAAAALVLVSVGPQLLNQAPDLALLPQDLPGAEEQMSRSPAPPPPAEADNALKDLQQMSNDLVRESKDIGGREPAKETLAKPGPAAPSELETDAAPRRQASAAPVAAKAAPAPLSPSSTSSSYGELRVENTVNNRDDVVGGSLSSTGVSANRSYDQVDLDEVATESTREKGRFNLRGDKAEDAEASGAVADNFEYANEEEEDLPVQAEALPSDLEGLRSAAAPRDYRGGWYLTGLDGGDYDRFEAAIDAAAAQSGSAKAQTYAALIGDPNTRIGQDMAFRAASAARAAGDNGTALGYLRSGQQRSSLNTAQRANLYYLEGQILEAQGDTPGAMAAYKVAANQNQAR